MYTWTIPSPSPPTHPPLYQIPQPTHHPHVHGGFGMHISQQQRVYGINDSYTSIPKRGSPAVRQRHHLILPPCKTHIGIPRVLDGIPHSVPCKFWLGVNLYVGQMYKVSWAFEQCACNTAADCHTHHLHMPFPKAHSYIDMLPVSWFYHPQV